MVRFKNRYIIIEITPSNDNHILKVVDIKQEFVYWTLVEKLKKLHGAFGYGLCKEILLVKYSNKDLGIVMIRVERTHHKMILDILPYITSIRGKKVTLRCLYIGATIKCCYKYLKKYQEQRLIEDLKKIKDHPKFKKLYKELLSRTCSKKSDEA